MTVESLREMARKVLGPGHSRLKKSELVAALEAAAGKAQAGARAGGAKARAAGSRAAKATGKAVKAAKAAGQSAKEGARAAARAGKAAAAEVASAVEEAVKPPRPKRAAGKVATAAAAVASAAAGAVAGVAAAVRAKRQRSGNGKPGERTPDPEGYFVARVRGEDAVREAPHPMTETTSDAPESFRAVEEGGVAGEGYQESLGELPWGYGDDAFVALPRDPKTLFLYWDFSGETTSAAFADLEHPRAQLWVFGRAGEGWERIRTIDFALESRGFYVHDLEPGRVYRAEVHAVDRSGRDRLVGQSSNEMMLPPIGPSSVIDDRFIRIPWEMPLGRLLGPGHAGGPFSAEARALLARLSDWSRFSPRGGGSQSAGGMGGRPTSPGLVSSPSSPFGPIATTEGR